MNDDPSISFKYLRLFVIPLYALLGILYVAYTGFTGGAVEVSNTESYSVQGTASLIQIILFESIFVFFILRPKSYMQSRGRALSALLLTGAYWLFWNMAAVNAPDFYQIHLHWLLLAMFMLSILLLMPSNKENSH